MKILTAEQMAYIDRATIESGTPGIELMRNAGSAVFKLITETLEIDRDAGIVVLAGKGNNGGDGFRVAELLVRSGYDSAVYLVGKKEDVRGDALTCMNDAVAAGQEIVEIQSADNLDRHIQKLMSAGVIVDALFGTGLKGEINGLPALIIDVVNESEAVVVAVDISSGVNSSTAETSQHTIMADYTVTFGCPKVGHIIMPGKHMCGDVTIVDIGFAEESVDSVEPFAYTLSSPEAASLIPCRPLDAYKGSVGQVAVIAGSVGMTGAVFLASRAAMRIGAGVVTVFCPASLNDILEIKLTEVMTCPLPEVKKKRCLSLRALGLLRESVKRADVVAVGPGLGTYFETTELVRRFISKYSGRVVLDADGINAFKDGAEILRSAPCEIVLTPHVGELANLMGTHIDTIRAEPFDAARKASEATGKIILLKGAPTIIADPHGNIWANSTGNEGMATAGMGDVLTGTISGLAAQGIDLLNAAILGAYLHGFAGEITSSEKGIHGVMSGDVLESLPEALLSILSEKKHFRDKWREW